MAKLAALTDQFSVNSIASKWNGSGGGTAITGGKAVIPVLSSYAGALGATGTHDFTDSYAYFEIITLPSTAGSREIYFEVQIDGSNVVGFNIASGSLIAQIRTAGVNSNTSATYDPVNHKWLKMSESGGVITWSTSPDGTTWTTFRTQATALVFTVVYCVMSAGYWGAEAAANFEIDNFNTLASVNNGNFLAIL